MTPLPRNAGTKANYAYFRRIWSPKAAYVLTRFHAFPGGPEKLAALIWLLGQRVPPSGAWSSYGPAGGINFKGLEVWKC